MATPARFPQPEAITQRKSLFLTNAAPAPPAPSLEPPFSPRSRANPRARAPLMGGNAATPYPGGPSARFGGKQAPPFTKGMGTRRAKRRGIAAIRAGGKSAQERQLEAMRAGKGRASKAGAEMRLERLRGVNPRTGD